jgi:hypothetical protein
MWVNEPVTVRGRGLLAQAHEFAAGAHHLARLRTAPGSGRESLELTDGAGLRLIGLGGWRREWLLWQDDSERAQGRASRLARRAELVYQAVPYFILPAGTWGCGYRLINEADMEVLSITFRGRLRREALLCPQVALEVALVVFAYDLARRLL